MRRKNLLMMLKTLLFLVKINKNLKKGFTNRFSCVIILQAFERASKIRFERSGNNFMRKIMTIRHSSISENKDAVQHRIVPIAVTALLLVFSIICVAAAEIAEAPEVEETFADVAYSVIEEPARQERAVVTVMYGGKEYVKCNSPIMTVGELLAKLDVEVREDDILSHSVDEMISDGMTLSVSVVTTETYTEETELPHGTVYKDSRTIKKGTTSLVEKGRNGIKSISKKVTMVDGAVVSTEVISEETVIEPVDAIYYKGVGGTVKSNDGTVYNYSYYIDVIATAYHTGGITATGHVANEEVVAVDPKVIPYGTKMFITGKWGEIGYRSAEDCGNFKGNRVDVCMEGTRAELLQFGRRNMRVYILE